MSTTSDPPLEEKLQQVMDMMLKLALSTKEAYTAQQETNLRLAKSMEKMARQVENLAANPGTESDSGLSPNEWGTTSEDGREYVVAIPQAVALTPLSSRRAHVCVSGGEPGRYRIMVNPEFMHVFRCEYTVFSAIVMENRGSAPRGVLTFYNKSNQDIQWEAGDTVGVAQLIGFV